MRKARSYSSSDPSTLYKLPPNQFQIPLFARPPPFENPSRLPTILWIRLSYIRHAVSAAAIPGMRLAAIAASIAIAVALSMLRGRNFARSCRLRGRRLIPLRRGVDVHCEGKPVARRGRAWAVLKVRIMIGDRPRAIGVTVAVGAVAVSAVAKLHRRTAKVALLGPAARCWTKRSLERMLTGPVALTVKTAVASPTSAECIRFKSAELVK